MRTHEDHTVIEISRENHIWLKYDLIASSNKNVLTQNFINHNKYIIKFKFKLRYSTYW